MAKKVAANGGACTPLPAAGSQADDGAHGVTRPTQRPSALLDTRVIYCVDYLDQLRRLPDACVDLIYIDPPFNSNRNYEVFWGLPREITSRAMTPHFLHRISRGETKEKRAFEDCHASTQAYIEFMRPHRVELARVLKKAASFYYHCDPTGSRSN